MPNHCTNRVTFYSDDTTVILRLHKIFSRALDENDTRTVFGAFIPEPNWAEIPLTSETYKEYSWDKPKGEIGEKPVMVINEDKPFLNGLRFKSTDRQDDRWYNWRNQNWGTKWDAYSMEIDDCEMPNGFEVEFQTAWAPPEEVCHAIREQFDDLTVSWFYDEPGCEVAGYL